MVCAVAVCPAAQLHLVMLFCSQIPGGDTGSREVCPARAAEADDGEGNPAMEAARGAPRDFCRSPFWSKRSAEKQAPCGRTCEKVEPDGLTLLLVKHRCWLHKSSAGPSPIPGRRPIAINRSALALAPLWSLARADSRDLVASRLKGGTRRPIWTWCSRRCLAACGLVFSCCLIINPPAEGLFRAGGFPGEALQLQVPSSPCLWCVHRQNRAESGLLDLQVSQELFQEPGGPAGRSVSLGFL